MPTHPTPTRPRVDWGPDDLEESSEENHRGRARGAGVSSFTADVFFSKWH